jgi:hypothetical protein
MTRAGGDLRRLARPIHSAWADPGVSRSSDVSVHAGGWLHPFVIGNRESSRRLGDEGMLLSLSTASALLPCATRSCAAARYDARIGLYTAARCDAPRMGLFDAFMESPEQKAATEARKEADFQNQQDILRR